MEWWDSFPAWSNSLDAIETIQLFLFVALVLGVFGIQARLESMQVVLIG